MHISISFFARLFHKLRTAKPEPKPDYSWMDSDQMAEWEAIRAIEMALFDADAKPVKRLNMAAGDEIGV